MTNPLDRTTYTVTLKDVRLVAILDESGGAIVEHFDQLEIHEGRTWTLSGGPEGNIAELEYQLNFNSVDDKPSDSQMAMVAQIVIGGTCEGARLEIRGEGFVGFDEFSQVSGQFLKPPRMFTDEEAYDSRVSDDDEILDGKPVDISSITFIDPVPSVEFKRALYGRSAPKHHGIFRPVEG